MKRKLLSVLLVLALVFTLGLVTAVPVAANGAILEVNGPPTQLTTEGGHYLGSFSPDGSQIVYDAGGVIWIMNTDGTNKSQVIGVTGQRVKWGPAIEGYPYGLIAIPGTGITIIEPNGTLVKTIDTTHSWGPYTNIAGTKTVDWSPDGMQLAFEDTAGTGGIGTVNFDGTGLTQITDYSKTAYSPTWSPDGTEIACAWGSWSTIQIGIFKSDGSQTTPLLVIGDPSHGDYPDWGSNNKIAYHVSTSNELYVINPDGTSDTKISDGPAAMVAWSSDGKKIAYIDGFANKNIWTRGYPYAVIQDAINDADPGDTVIVAAGLYNERLTINTSLDLRGARYGVDPTPSGARTTPADESVITEAGLPTPNPDILIEIPAGVLGVTLDGFTLNGDQTNTVADTSVVRIWGDNATISNNIIDGMFGVIYKGGDTLAVHQNRMVVNKVGVVVQPNPATNVTISDNVITLGSTPAGDEQGIYMTSCTQSSVTGNTATGFIHNAALAGSNLDHLTVSGNTLTGNAAGISIWGNSTFITVNNNNVLSDSLATDWSDSGCGISIKGQDIVITGNQITNNADIGVKIDYHQIATERVIISQNNIAGNTNYGVWVNTQQVTEIVNATNNWWGSVNGPTHASNTFNVDDQGGAVSDLVDFVPWLNAPDGEPFAPVRTTDPIDSFASIQAGVTASNATGTVIVAAGTYTEDVTINAGLILKSAELHAAVIEGYVTIAADGVNIDGFKIDPIDMAVMAHKRNGVIVQNVLVEGGDGPCIWVQGDEANLATGVIIRDNTLRNTTSDSGLHVNFTDGAVVDGNVIKNTPFVAILTFGNKDITIEGNILDGNLHGIAIHETVGAIFTGNTVTNSEGTGVEIASTSNAVLEFNKITLNNVGIGQYDGWWPDAGETINNVVNYNNIVDNEENGVCNWASLDFTLNWWGSANGPGQDGANGVLGDVDYSPWLPGTWETYYDPVEEELIDSDKDGYSDLDEYWLGTDPEVGTDFPGAAIDPDKVDTAYVEGDDPVEVNLEDSEGDPIADVDISDAPEGASGTITGARYTEDPGDTALSVGTGTTGVVFLDVKVTGYTSGTALITVPYLDEEPDPEGGDGIVDGTTIVETTLGLYYWDETTSVWLIADNNLVNAVDNKVSGDIPVSALTGTPVGMGGYLEEEALVAIESILNLNYSVEGAIGGTVTLTIDTNTAFLGAATIELTFDPRVVEVVAAENGAFGTLTVNTNYAHSGSDTQIARFVAHQTGEAGINATEGVVVAVVKLNAVGSTMDESPLSLKVITLKDNEGDIIPSFLGDNNSIAIVGGIGDADRNGVVDAYDLVYIARAIAGFPDYSIDVAVMNVSGETNLDAWDCTYLARHLVGIPDYPLGG